MNAPAFVHRQLNLASFHYRLAVKSHLILAGRNTDGETCLLPAPPAWLRHAAQAMRRDRDAAEFALYLAHVVGGAR